MDDDDGMETYEGVLSIICVVIQGLMLFGMFFEEYNAGTMEHMAPFYWISIFCYSVGFLVSIGWSIYNKDFGIWKGMFFLGILGPIGAMILGMVVWFVMMLF